MKDIKEFIKNGSEEMYRVFKELCLIPAPSHYEQERANYLKNLLESYGAKGVYIDSSLNVLFPVNCEGQNEITVMVAHTDTVFPDTEPMPYREENGLIHCPGAGDDTASVAVLLQVAKYFIEKNIKPEKGFLFAFNSCEEGLGDLKGTKTIFRDFSGRIAQFISLDGMNLSRCADRCAGSHRYEVEVTTPGGHSFLAFGNKNAIAVISGIINEIYSIEIPVKGNLRTTYNVGEISGGTSVNTIAQSAKILCEYRSEDYECLAFMEEQFKRIFKNAEEEEVSVNVKKVGDRPCGNIEEEKIDRLKEIIDPIVFDVTGSHLHYAASSTDCNVPLSLGIPAICIAVYNGKGAHTREEYVEKASLIPGAEIAIRTALALGEVI